MLVKASIRIRLQALPDPCHCKAGGPDAGLSCWQVSTFGSVPLKTYLPDGDIDVVAFASGQPFRSQWANEVRAALDREEKKQQAEFRVREVQFIQAEVRGTSSSCRLQKWWRGQKRETKARRSLLAGEGGPVENFCIEDTMLWPTPSSVHLIGFR